MKIDDPKLTAFVLGELSPEESREVQQAIRNDKKIAAEVKAIEDVIQLVSLGYGDNQLRLSAKQRGKIFAAGSSPTIEDISSAKTISLFPWLASGVGIAATITLLLAIMKTTPTANSPSTGFNYNTFTYKDMSAQMAAGTSDWAPDSTISAQPHKDEINQALAQEPQNFLVELKKKIKETNVSTPTGSYQETDWIQTKNINSTHIPLSAGRTSWEWISQALHSGQEIPPSSIRPEELINSFREPFVADFNIKSVTASLELVKCPWNPNTLTAVIQFSNTSHQAVPRVSAGISFSDSVREFRVIGYAKQSKLTSPSTISMESGYTHTIIYEIVLKDDSPSYRKLVNLHLKVGEREEQHSYNYSPRDFTAASLSSQLPLALAHWAQWKAKSSKINTRFSEVQSQLTTVLKSTDNKNTQDALIKLSKN